jgi:hypothetical protein
MVGVRQISNNGYLGSVLCHMQDIALGNPVTPKHTRVRVISDLQDTPLDMLGVGSQKTFNVIAIDRLAALAAPMRADGLQPPETSKAHQTNWRPAGVAHNPASRGDGQHSRYD